MRRALIAFIAVILCAAPATARSEREKDAQGFYILWGMMDRAASFCWEAVDWDPAYMEAGENWKARNLQLRDEMDAVLADLTGSSVLVSEVEAIGAARMEEALLSKPDPRAFCAELLAGIDAGVYDGETYLAEQLGRLRERDGM